MALLELINLLLAFMGGGAAVTALQLFSGANGSALAEALLERFPVEYQVACGALGAAGLAVLVLGALTLTARRNRSLSQRRALLTLAAGALLALLLAEGALAAWLVVRARAALEASPADAGSRLRVLLEQVGVRRAARSDVITLAVVAAMLQAAACACAAWAARHAHQDLRLRSRYSTTSISNNAYNPTAKCLY